MKHRDMASCAECGMNYVPGSDARAHARWHRRWLSATTDLGYEPRENGERERLKQEGRELARSVDPQDRLRGAEMVLRGWFDRSLMAAIIEGYWRQHPTFERYVAMMDLEGLLAAHRVATELRTRFGPRPPGIGDGRSFWEPNGASARPHPSLARSRGAP